MRLEGVGDDADTSLGRRCEKDTTLVFVSLRITITLIYQNTKMSAPALAYEWITRWRHVSIECIA